MAALPVDELRLKLAYDPVTGVVTSLAFGRASGWKMLNGYIGVSYSKTGRLYAHRVAWALTHGEWPPGVVDHINGDRTDNRLCNLRCVSTKVNGQNIRAAHKDNTTGLLGVSYNKREGRYIAQLVTVGMPKWTRRFDDPEVAHQAYLAEKRRRHVGCTI